MSVILASPHISLNILGNLVHVDDENFHLEKTLPSLSHRYDRTISFSRNPVSFTVCCEEEKPIIHGNLKGYGDIASFGWVEHVHPEGLVYYHHPVGHVVTDANLTDIETHSKVTRWMNEFYKIKTRQDFDLPADFELLLELDLENEGGKYYLVDHDKLRIFYFGDTNTRDLGLPDVYSENHLKLQLEGQYWNHIESFPMHHPLPPLAKKTLMSILNHAWADRAMSSLSTSPFSTKQCKEFLDILRTSSDESGKEGYHAWVVARLMKCFIFARFINRFGEIQGARLSRNQSCENKDQTSPTLLFRLISIVLFNQPGNKLDELNELWVDNVVYTEHWRLFNVARVEELYGVCAMASLLLIASNVMNPDNSSQSMDIAVTISQYGAAACQCLCLSAIVLAFKRLLIHKPFQEASIFQAGEFLTNADRGKYGLQSLAMVLSLPLALLMWAVAAMVVSLVSVNLEYFVGWQALLPDTFIIGLMTVVLWGLRG